jgi:hypothetical protein
MWQQTVFVVHSTNPVSQHNADEVKGSRHASSKTCLKSSSDKDEPCEVNDGPLAERTKGTDEEDTKVSRMLRLTFAF